jgi:hypothetical protein
LFFLNKINFKKLKISHLLSYSLLAQRILNQVQHRHQQKKGHFSRGVFAFLFRRKPKPHDFSKFLPRFQKFLTKNSCYTAEKKKTASNLYVKTHMNLKIS